jgi:hypothetical protein
VVDIVEHCEERPRLPSFNNVPKLVGQKQAVTVPLDVARTYIGQLNKMDVKSQSNIFV